MKKVKYEDKFFVLNTKKIIDLPLSDEFNEFVTKISEVVELYESLIGESMENKKYYVCNQDEPYANKVWEIIEKGEDSKLNPQDKKKPTIKELCEFVGGKAYAKDYFVFGTYCIFIDSIPNLEDDWWVFRGRKMTIHPNIIDCSELDNIPWDESLRVLEE